MGVKRSREASALLPGVDLKALSSEAIEVVRWITSSDNWTMWNLNYQDEVWANAQRAPAFPSQASAYRRPVGLVLQGVLEVTEEFEAKDRKNRPTGEWRRRTTALIESGNFFGLFESVANLYGPWKIHSGISNVFISNRMGDRRSWVDRREDDTTNWDMEGELTHELVATLKDHVGASFDYRPFIQRALTVPGTNHPKPTSAVLLFDSAAIDRLSPLWHYLQDATIRQLASFARQRAWHTFSLPTVPAAQNEEMLLKNLRANPQYEAYQRVHAALEAMAKGQVPLFRPLQYGSDVDKSAVPAIALQKYRPLGEKAHPLHVFMPSYYRGQNAHAYVHELNHDFDITRVRNYLSAINKLKSKSLLGLKVEELTFGGKYWVEFDAKISLGPSDGNTVKFGLTRIKRAKGKDIPIPEHFKLPMEPEVDPYSWFPRLRDMLIIYPAA